MFFNVKMDFTRKSRWLLDGYKTPNLIGSSYACFVSRDSVCIAFTYTTLNDLAVFAADMTNDLQVPSSQNEYIICGPEFGLENVEYITLQYRVLYGDNNSGCNFRNHLRS